VEVDEENAEQVFVQARSLCPETEKLFPARFSKGWMVQVARKVNACMAPAEKVKERTIAVESARVGLASGIHRTTWKYRASGKQAPWNQDNTRYADSYNVTFSLFGEFPLKNPNWWLRAELVGQTHGYLGVIAQVDKIEYVLSGAYRSLSIPLLLKYQQRKGIIRLYAQAGGMLMLSTEPELSYRSYEDVENTFIGNRIEDIPENWTSVSPLHFLIGGGATFSLTPKLIGQLDFRHSVSPFTPITFFRPGTQQLTFGIAYQLFIPETQP